MKRMVLDRIAAEGHLPFDEYMAMCLYDPDDGFFAAGRVRSGTSGDFVTSPEVSPWFGRLIARWVVTHGAGPASLIEVGAGSGALLEELLPQLDPAPRSVYAVEMSASARDEIAGRVPSATIVESLDDVSPEPAEVIVVNEVFDNMPCRLVARDGDVWTERVVGADGEVLVWETVRADRELADWCAVFLPDATEGTVYAAQVAMTTWIARTLDRGSCSLLAVDYAADTQTLGERGIEQVVRTFRSHAEGYDALAAPGETDLTVEVNTDVLVRAVDHAGGRSMVSTQADFLDGLGASDVVKELVEAGFGSARKGDVMAQLAAKSEATGVRALLDPAGLGGFTVFHIQSGT